MGKIIFYVAIVGLCFGQSIWLKENPKITLPAPISTYIRPTNTGNSLTESKPPFQPIIANSLQNCFYANALMLQVAADSLQPKTSFWKQTGIYGLEFVGAGVGSVIPSILGLAMALYNTIDNPGDPSEGYEIYIIGNALLSSTSCWFVGKLYNQDNSWWKSAIGAAVGSGIGVFVLDKWMKKEEKGSFYPEGIIFFGVPPLCATIGLNL